MRLRGRLQRNKSQLHLDIVCIQTLRSAAVKSGSTAS
jgi:hypothetical protein